MGYGFRTPPPLKNHKAIRFLSNTGPDPLKNYKDTKPAFNVGPSCEWRYAGSPIMACFLLVVLSFMNPLSPYQLKKLKKK